MALDSVSKLGKALGDTSKQVETIKENLNPNDPAAINTVILSDTTSISGTVTGTGKYYSSDSFIIDHVVLGDIDSSTLKIDGGYHLYSESDGVQLYLDMTANPDDSNTVSDIRQVYPTSTANDGTYKINMSALYDMTDGSGTTLTDNSVNSNDGTITGATWTTDHLGNANSALSFNGSNYASVANFGLSDHTIFGWIKSSSASGGSGADNEVILGNYAGGSSKYSCITLDGSNLSWRIDDGVNSYTAVADSSFDVDTWYFVALTYHSDGTTTAYLNGSSISSINYTASVTFDSLPFQIAKQDGGHYFEGVVSQAGVIPVALSADEVANLYNYTRVHKLTSPLVTKTDSDGNSITGYEMIGKSTDSGAADVYGTQIDLGVIDIDASDTYTAYSEFILTQTDINQILLGGQSNSTTVAIGITSGNVLRTAQDDRPLIGTTVLTTNKRYRVITEYSREGLNHTQKIYLDGVLEAERTEPWSDTYGNDNWYVGTDARYNYHFNGVITKPLIFDRVLTETERTALFANQLPFKTLFTKTL
jgi:hypothetical protein